MGQLTPCDVAVGKKEKVCELSLCQTATEREREREREKFIDNQIDD